MRQRFRLVLSLSFYALLLHGSAMHAFDRDRSNLQALARARALESRGAYDQAAKYYQAFLREFTQKEFLFQALPYSLMPSAHNPMLSFRIILKDNDFVIVNASPDAPTACPDFGKNFAGTIGPASQLNLQLTRKGPMLSGTQEYARIGETLWLSGHADSFGFPWSPNRTGFCARG